MIQHYTNVITSDFNYLFNEVLLRMTMLRTEAGRIFRNLYRNSMLKNSKVPLKKDVGGLSLPSKSQISKHMVQMQGEVREH